MKQNYPSKNTTLSRLLKCLGLFFLHREEQTIQSFSRILHLILLFTVLCSQFSFGQTVTVPAANTNSGSVNDPFGTFWGFERTAMIYTSGQIGTTGTINQVGFYLNSVSAPGAATNVRIYMKMRTTLMTAVTAYTTETTGATLVYGPTTIASGSFAAGWVTIPLATPFVYTGGADNLEIIIETNATGAGNEGSTAKQFRQSSPGSNQYYQYWADDNTAPVATGTLGSTRPNIQLNFAAATPTITSLGSASGCVGTSITINGTNLTGATAANVKIGGTAVSSITSNSGTALAAVIGSGTTGTVEVTTGSGTATSVATFTVNALPANPGNPTSNSPQCATPGVTLTRAGAPPGGETWYWQTASLGTSTANSGSTYNVTTSGTYYIRAQNNTTGCWSSGQGTLAVTVTSIPSALATVPSPSNAATGVCYAGTGPVTAVSWTAAALATSYDVYFGTIATPPFVVNQAATSWTISPVLAASTTYYWKIVPKNACGDTTGSPVTWSFTTSSAPCYCASYGGTLADGVTGVIFNTISNTGTAVNVAYTDYTAISTSVTKGSSYNLSVYVNTAGNYTNHQTVWIDWNGDNDFVDAGESFALGTVVNNANGLSALCPLSIAVPVGAITGSVRMRIQSKWGSVSTSCETGFDGETEDYTINITGAPVPTITSLSSASGCVGSSITITGTNLSSASAVTIGGTAVASITSNTATQIVAVVGTGTTGTVAVTTSGGTATSAATFTVNALPANPGNPTSNSPQCTTPGVTLTQAGSPPGGETWYWQTASLGISTANSGSTYNVTTSGTYYIRAQNNTTGCWSSGQGSLAVTVNVFPSALATVPTPSDAATGVCYAGSGPTTQISWTAAALATSYDVYFGTIATPPFIINQAATSWTISPVLAANTTYYWKIIPKNSCGATTGSPVTWSFTTATASCYCTPTYSSGDSLGDEITNVSLGTLTNTTGASASPYYTFYNAVTIPNLLQSSTASVSVSLGTDSNQYVGVWIDFNQDGTFQATEGLVSGNAGVSGTVVLNLPVPAGATLGNTRMRVRGGNDSVLLTSQACGASSSSFGETEDYTVNITGSVACTTPTAQPTTLLLTPTGNSIGGSFTLASPAADIYLVVINTTGIAPSPTNLTAYTIGSTVGAGNTVVDIDGNGTFTATGLSPLTTYYVFVFSNNSACSGGPLYYTTSPLNGSAATSGAVYCTPTGNLDCTLSDYISNVTFNLLNNTTTCGAGGYTNYAATGAQTTSLMKGSSYNFNLRVGSGSGTHGAGVWIDFNQNGSFADAGEFFLVSNAIAASSTTTVSIPIPVGANNGATRMRVRYGYSATIVSTMSCTMSGSYGETEDYTITLVAAAVCATPTAQATALVLTPTGNAIGGSFTLASPAADNYLVIINTTGAVPAPANGTTYSIGGTVGAGNTVIDIDNNTTFTAIGLFPLTTYYVFVFSYNSLCTGGPLYNTTSPLNGNCTTTAASSYCSPSVTTGFEDNAYISNVSFVGTLNDTSNNSTYSSSPIGFQDFTALATKSRQAQGEGVNIFVQALNSSYMKGWVDWNKDGDFADTGELVYDTGGVATYSTTFGFIVPPATAVGDYRVRVRINSRDNTSPFDPASTSTFTSCGNINYPGETEDYLFTVVSSCSALITAVTDGVVCGTGTVVLNAAGPGVQFRWYTSLTGGAAVATTLTGVWTTPSLATTTTYYVTADNGCESLVRTPVVAKVNPIPTLNFTPSSPVVCGENVVIALTAGGDTQQMYLINEDFEGGMGVFSNTNYISNTGAINTKTAWQSRTSTFVPVEQVWFPAISSGFGTNKFVMTTSDVGAYDTHNALLSPTVNSTNYQDLTLTFKAYYSRYYIDGSATSLDYVTVDVSTNGGSSWTELTRYTSDIGIGTRFESKSFNLNAYINQPNLKVRIRYYGEWVDGIAIDDVKLFGFVPLNTGFNWTSATTVNAYSDAGCTIPYIPFTPIATVYVKPTLIQLETGTYDFTANAILSNGCSASQIITVTNTSKVWQNITNDWNNPANWKPLGIPTSANCVIIPNHSIISGSGFDAYAKNLTVKATGILDLESNNNLTVTEWVDVNTGGVFNIKNNASLVQINNVANTGIVRMDRTSSLRKLDYEYWASPVAGFASSAISTGTPTGYIYKWNPTIPTNTNGWGNWASGNESMTIGKGYIVRGPNSFTTTFQNFTATLIGVPNNGNITTPISRGSYDGADYTTTGSSTLATKNDDNWNLIGNPYPSALNAINFLTANTNITGFIKIWTHGSLPTTAISDPFYSDYVYNYNPADYITYNVTGTSSGPSAFAGNIGAGQGFFVLMNHTSAATTENVTFNNTMRSNTYNNDEFFRDASDSENADPIERNRIWLDLVSASGNSVRTLVGYISGATNSKDRLYDAITDNKLNFNLYSLTDNEKMTIQGRALPFDPTDTVPMGLSVPQNGNYSIAIAEVDGLFTDANQLVFIEDLQTGLIHNLRTAPYSFTATAGGMSNRFVLRFTDTALGTDTFDISNTVSITVNEKVTVRSSAQPIKNIMIYDLLGRKIDSYKNLGTTQFTLNHLAKTMNVLIVKTTLENDVVVTEKIIY